MPYEASALIDQLTATISITERSASAEVTVTVDQDGAVTAIEFGLTAAGLPPARLSTITMDTIRRATGKIGDRYTRVVRESGLDDDNAERIIANYRTRHPSRFAEENHAIERVTDDRLESTGFAQAG